MSKIFNLFKDDSLDSSQNPGSSLPQVPLSPQIGTRSDGTPIRENDSVGQGKPMPSGAQQGIGAAQSIASLAGYGPQAAAIAAAAYGTYNGLMNAKDTYNQGGKAKQTGVIKGFNAAGSPLTGFVNTNDDVSKGIGAVMGNPIAIADIAGFNFFSGKSKEQAKRDAFRKFLEENKFANYDGKTHYLPGSSGNTHFDFGRDGNNRLKNASGVERRLHEVDLEDPLQRQAIDQLGALGTILAHQSGQGDFRHGSTGYLVNGAVEGAKNAEDVKRNVLAQYQQSGFSPEQIAQGLDELTKGGKLTAEEAKIMRDHVASLTNNPGGLTPATGQMPILPGKGFTINVQAPPQPKPQVDMSLLSAPQTGLDKVTQNYEQAKQQNQTRLSNLFGQSPAPVDPTANMSLFPQRRSAPSKPAQVPGFEAFK